MFEYKITDADIIGGNKNLLKDVTRYASRGLLVDDNNITLIHMPKNGYYKLPGGGLEEFETPEMALVREVKEETGYSLTSVKLFGYIEEHKTHNNFLQYSYCFYAKKGTEESNKKLTDNEKELGLRVVWISYKEALDMMEKSFYECTDYSMRYMLLRDTLIIKNLKAMI